MSICKLSARVDGSPNTALHDLSSTYTFHHPRILSPCSMLVAVGGRTSGLDPSDVAKTKGGFISEDDDTLLPI